MTREEAIEQLKWYFEEDDGIGADPSTKKAYKVVLEVLAKMEAIQIELTQKKGVWIMGNGMGTTCSNCYYKLETTGLPSKCPCCGAQMEGQV